MMWRKGLLLANGFKLKPLKTTYHMVTDIKRKITADPYNCPLTAALDKIGGRWKPIILFYLSNGSRRFGQLAVTIPRVSKKVLTQQLKQLEQDGLVSRTPSKELPPRVDYALTDFGKSVLPILNGICDWGKQYAISNDMEIELTAVK
jgi:DNA-binding HxlR family transcriptional regulator